jgi:hypothetical protein
MAHYEQYQSTHAPALQLKTRERYGDRVSAFRSLLEVLDSSDVFATIK